MSKKVLVIGGLGFIGHHISKTLSREHHVSIAYRSANKQYESDFDLLHLDLSSMSIVALKDLLGDFTYVIFCGGADDRRMPEGDADSFYYKENVLPCCKLVEAVLDTKVEKVLILGSYLSHFDRELPEWKLKERHPYIQSRYLQQVEPRELAGTKVDVCTVEIPYVFGAAPGKVPLWKPLVDYINKTRFVLYSKGGTNIMSVEQLGQAIQGILLTEEDRPTWIVGSENVKWTTLIKMFSLALGKKRSVILLPNFILKVIGALVKLYFTLTKKKTGLDPYHYIEVQTSDTYLDVDESMRVLGYRKVDMQISIDDTVEACGYLIKK